MIFDIQCSWNFKFYFGKFASLTEYLKVTRTGTGRELSSIKDGALARDLATARREHGCMGGGKAGSVL